MGLGNCLLLWAYGLVFAKINNLDAIVGRWSRYRWGAILRREKKKRRYKGYFLETPYSLLLVNYIRSVFYKKYYDPEIKRFDHPSTNTIFIFRKPFPRRILFEELLPYEDFIRDSLYGMLSPVLKKKIELCPRPEIAVHVRRGDFKFGNPITSNEFFISAIRQIRGAAGMELKVTVFTDAYKNEIAEILSLRNVILSNNKEDILDILQMSKARYLVLSESSSFSYWAAFLSRAFVIMSAADWQRQIKPNRSDYHEYRYKTRDEDLNLIAEIKRFND